MFEVALEWSSDAEVPGYLRDRLPEEISVQALPPEETVIDLRSGDETGEWLFSVEVDYVRLNAEDPDNTFYTAYVIHA